MHVSRLIRRSLEKIRAEIATDGTAERRAPRPQARRTRTRTIGFVCAPLRSCARASSPSSSRRATNGCRPGPSFPRADDHSTLLTSPACSRRCRTSSARAAAGPSRRPCRSASGRPTSTRSASTATTSRSSRCSGTSRSGSTSRKARSSSRRSSSRPPAHPVGARLGDGARGRPRARARRGRGRQRAWLKIGMPRERIVGLPSSENFWSVGGPGPCGPTRRSTSTTARSTAAAIRVCPRVPALRPLPRVLEPRLHGVRAARGRHAHAAAEAERRHGPRRRARRDPPQGVRSVYETDGYQTIMQLDRGGERRRLGLRTRPPRKRIASSPTTAAA